MPSLILEGFGALNMIQPESRDYRRISIRLNIDFQSDKVFLEGPIRSNDM